MYFLKVRNICETDSVGFGNTNSFSLYLFYSLSSVSQVNKLKRDLACMKQELQYKEQGFETLKE